MSDKYIIKSNDLKSAFSSIKTAIIFLDGVNRVEESIGLIKEKIESKRKIEKIIVDELKLDRSNPKNIENLLTISEMASRYSNDIIDKKISLNEVSGLIKKTFSNIEIDKSNEIESHSILDEFQSYNIKLSLFESTKKLIELFDSELFKGADSARLNAQDAMNQIIDMSYSISKEWISVSNKTEKEFLLSELLPMVTDIYIDTYIDNILRLTEKSYRIYNEKDFWISQKQLATIIESMDMGYQNSEDVNLAWLKSRIYESIKYYVSLFLSSISFLKSRNIEDFKVLMFEKMTTLSIDSWLESGNLYLDQCNGMTEEEFNEWAKNEGSKPMPYENFLKILEEKVTVNSGLLHEGSLDLNDVNRDTKERVSMLWGMSDAIFKMSKVNEI